MYELALSSSRSVPTSRLPLPPVPVPKVGLNIRPAVVGDLPFMDRLQKMHSKAVGFMPTAQYEGHIKAGKVLIAEESAASPVGYLLAADRYFKHDDVGIIYQMNVLPEQQRGYVAAAMLKAQFERSAYGCKLYCCWCAQDLAANKFWEAMGFVPLAFRTGSEKRSRIHIFWQKRIREGDEETPWWFPSETSGGAIKENRIVLPIPPGTHWSEAKPLVLPALSRVEGPGELSVVSGDLSVVREKRKRAAVEKKELVVLEPRAIVSGGLRFAAVVPSVIVEKPEVKKEKVRAKNDPQLVAAARELKDRWLEELAAGRYLPEGRGKYEVSRLVGGRAEIEPGQFAETVSDPVPRIAA